MHPFHFFFFNDPATTEIYTLSLHDALPIYRDRSFSTQAVAGEIDAMGVVNQAIEDGVGVGRIADQRVPLFDRDLAGDDGRAPAVAFFEDLEEVMAGTGIERLKPPIV